MNFDEVIAIGNSDFVDVELLSFDVNNPRFTPDKRPEGDSDAAIIEKLVSTADLSELIQSIATSGYINIEPLIVFVRNDALVVLEGNRRLAAIKALRTPALAQNARVTIPDLTEQEKAQLDRVLVYRVGDESEARDLIGFKHINGPQGWDAFAKAKYAAQWLDSESAKQDGLSLSQIAARMGDQHDTIHRMVTAMYVLEQAEASELFSVTDRFKKSFSFSHLYTGLSYAEFTNYLGLERPDREADPAKDAVDEEHFPQLKNLLLWLYGSKTEAMEPVVKSQNPDLRRLRTVLASPAGIRVLEERRDLGDAIVTATPKSERFESHLINANAELNSAVQALEGFSPTAQSELVVIAESAFKKAGIIKRNVDAEFAAAQIEDEREDAD